uniref:G-protein coupled receptors family 1 profile domain-containing protein n=2 Tax=Pygocentrus nattereri TaxID=42514 RepID=A0A3B4BVS0_PYGNA
MSRLRIFHLKRELSHFTVKMVDVNFDLSSDYPDYNYTADNQTYEEVHTAHRQRPICSGEVFCMLLLVFNALIFVLGVVGNGVVIWIAGFKMKKSVNTTWYLSLALSDFIYCASLPFNTIYMATLDWTFGLFMCKFTSFVMFLNMFSSIFVLVVISMDRCVSVMFPVWAQNQRTISKASVMVILSWIVSAALSIPSVVYRDVQQHLGTSRCLNNYTTSQYSHATIAMSRFILGFVIPFLIIIICYSIIIVKLRSNQMAKSTKPFKVMTALIVAFFMCWMPYHTFVLIELNQSLSNTFLTLGLQIGSSTASANSFLNPILYVFMGNDFRRKFKSSILSKIENAMGEEGRTLSRYLSRSSSMDARASTHI